MSRGGSLRRRRGRAMVAVALAAAALGTIAYATHLMRALELQGVDARFAVLGTQERPGEIVVVQVDDRTFSELGVQWPFPRSLHARVIDRLRRAGAKAVAFDVQFTEPTAPAQDNALIEAIEREPGVVLSTTEVDADGHSRIFGGEEVVRAIGARAASTIVEPDPGGTIRKLSYEVDGLTSFAVATAEAATGVPIEAGELEADGRAWIDYRGPRGPSARSPTRGSCGARCPTRCSVARRSSSAPRRPRCRTCTRPRPPATN